MNQSHGKSGEVLCRLSWDAARSLLGTSARLEVCEHARSRLDSPGRRQSLENFHRLQMLMEQRRPSLSGLFLRGRGIQVALPRTTCKQPVPRPQFITERAVRLPKDGQESLQEVMLEHCTCPH